MTCAHCNAPMTGRKRKYCNRTCSNRAFSVRRIADGRLKAQQVKHQAKRSAWSVANAYRYTLTKTCPCGIEFSCLATCPDQIHCSKSCAQRFVNGFCRLPIDHPAMVLLAANHAAQRTARRNTESGTRVHHRYKFKPGKARRAFIYERDAWTCQLCSGPVDPNEIPTANWAASLDHVVPRSKGGSDRDDNLRLAHRWCNSVRGDDTYYTAADLAA